MKINMLYDTLECRGDVDFYFLKQTALERNGNTVKSITFGSKYMYMK